MTEFYQMTTRVANQIYQLASQTTKKVWNEIKKDELKKVFVIHAYALAAILILAGAFLVLTGLVLPFFASSASSIYLGMLCMTIPLTLFLSVVVGYMTTKQVDHHFLHLQNRTFDDTP